MATGERDVVPAAGVSHAAQRLACEAGGADDRVDDRQRRGPHGGEVVDVGQDGRDPGAVRVGGDEAGEKGLAAGDHMTALGDAGRGRRVNSLGHHRAVVTGAVHPAAAADDVGDERDLAFGSQRGVRA